MIYLDFLTFLIAAVFVERTIEYFIKPTSMAAYAKWFALGLSVVFSVAYKLDLFATLGFVAVTPVVGHIVTGLVISGGSNYLNDFMGVVRSQKKTGASDATSEGAPIEKQPGE